MSLGTGKAGRFVCAHIYIYACITKHIDTLAKKKKPGKTYVVCRVVNSFKSYLSKFLYMLKVVNNTTRCKKNVYSRY